MVEWDEAKRLKNLEKHEVDFDAVAACDWSLAYVVEDARKDYGERRYVAFVPLDERIHVIVYVVRTDARRLISARKANAREVRFYEAQMDPSH
jgi:uncharacterized DUF497 family protein